MKNSEINSTKGYIISNPDFDERKDNLQLLRIIMTPEETKIDFGYQANDEYDKGGWIKINPKTFIRPVGTSKKFFLTNATNIPYGPELLHFQSTIEYRYFSLHFPPIPKTVKSIELIEKEHGNSTDFNFFGIILADPHKIDLII